MRSAETCLAIIRTRGERRLPIDDLYRQLFNPEFYLQAYGKIYRNDGAMTPGTTPETVDGMSLDEDSGHHRCPALRAVSMVARATDVHPQEERDARVRSACPRGPTSCCRKSMRQIAGGVLRTAVQRPLTRIPTGPWLPYRLAGDLLQLEGNGLVHRRGHSRLFRQPRPPGLDVDSPREDPRPALPPADREPAQGRISGGMALSRDPERLAARGHRESHPRQHLP